MNISKTDPMVINNTWSAPPTTLYPLITIFIFIQVDRSSISWHEVKRGRITTFVFLNDLPSDISSLTGFSPVTVQLARHHATVTPCGTVERFQLFWISKHFGTSNCMKYYLTNTLVFIICPSTAHSCTASTTASTASWGILTLPCCRTGYAVSITLFTISSIIEDVGPYMAISSVSLPLYLKLLFTKIYW